MITFDQVKFAYKGQSIYEELSLSFNGGQVLGLLGKNGSGKSTLLSLVAGLNFAQNGRVTTLGFNAKQRRAEMLSQIFLLPEQYQLPAVSGKSYVAMYSPFYPGFNQQQFLSYADTFEIELGKKLSKLSMGQQKKFLIAFGLACNCPLNLLDEPTNGLDIPSKTLFRKLISHAADESKTFVISTHQVKDIEKLIDHVCMIEKGELVLNQSVDDITKQLAMSITDELDGSELYKQEVGLGQYACVSENRNGEPGTLDLELLFNAVLDETQSIKAVFGQSSEERGAA